MRALPVVGAKREVPLYEGDMQADMLRMGRRSEAEKITGKLMYPSKMDVPSFGIPAEQCKTGMRLRSVVGSTCNSCYALKGTFRFKNVQDKLRHAYEGIFHKDWTPAMAAMINWHATDRFRWFASGDLAGVNHLRNIIQVCEHTRQILHWLPSREYETVRACREEIPDNLTIRLSGTMVDGPPPSFWTTTSTVVSHEEDATCPSSVNGGSCKANDCTDCWDQGVRNIAYLRH